MLGFDPVLYVGPVILASVVPELRIGYTWDLLDPDNTGDSKLRVRFSEFDFLTVGAAGLGNPTNDVTDEQAKGAYGGGLKFELAVTASLSIGFQFPDPVASFFAGKPRAAQINIFTAALSFVSPPLEFEFASAPSADE